MARCKAKTAAVTNALRGRALNGRYRKALPAIDEQGQSRDSGMNHPRKMRLLVMRGAQRFSYC